VFDSPGGEEARRIGACLEEMAAFLDEVTAERQRRPSGDLISALLRAESVDGALTADEVTIFIFTLLVAGNVTTTNLIGNATLALLEHPAELARLVADRSLVPLLVEEALRYDSPAQLLFRTATEDVEIAGVRIPAGAVVAPLFASANRDERVFPDPDRFDVTRDPKEHLAFGHGIHFCLGAALARLEARVAFDALFSHVRSLVRREDELEWIDSLALRGLRRLRIEIEPPAARAGHELTRRAPAGW
jgi:cytochrome P450